MEDWPNGFMPIPPKTLPNYNKGTEKHKLINTKSMGKETTATRRW